MHEVCTATRYTAPMEWLRTHPLLDAVVSASALLIVGALFVRAQLAPAAHVTSDTTWGSGSGILVSPVSDPHASLSQDTYAGPGPTAKDVGLIQLASQNTIGTGPVDESEGFDLAAFAAMLSNPTSKPSAADTASDAYDFIPSGLIATTTLSATRTSKQDALYIYGNEVGDAIVSFEGLHPNQPAVLKNHAEQPGDADAKAALKALGDDFIRLGDSLSGLSAPAQTATAHKALVAAYKDLGTKLSAVSQSSGDGLYDSIVAYDAAADDFAKKFVALALIFQAYGVMFSPGDGGSVFVFPSSGL